jgi:RNA polymerase sigma-70 factor (ECF subfamily)
MERTTTAALQASLEVARRQFLAAVGDLRPKLHRFCTRMCGSVLDGEDVVQEALAQAFYNLPSLKDQSRLEPWLFRIAHHKCIDLLRQERRQREDTVPYEEEHEPESTVAESEVDDEPIGETLAALVGVLPPKERASVLLKDVLQYRLAEVAEVVDSTVAGVKAALHRGRGKLRALHEAPSQVELDRRHRKLLDSYVECFNRRDWDALRRLIQADARLELVDTFVGKLEDSGYFGKYAALPWEWKLSLARVDGEPMIVHWKKVGADWRPHAAIRLWWQGGKVVRIKDYAHVDYLLRYAHTEADEATSG